MHMGNHLSIALNTHRIAHVQKFLLDLQQLMPLHILKEQGMAYTQHFSIDEEDARSKFILDIEIIPKGDEFLAHLVTMTCLTFRSVSKPSSEHIYTPPSHLTQPLWRLLLSCWGPCFASQVFFRPPATCQVSPTLQQWLRDPHDSFPQANHLGMLEK